MTEVVFRKRNNTICSIFTLFSVEGQKVAMRPSVGADLMTVLVDIFDVVSLTVNAIPLCGLNQSYDGSKGLF